MSQILSGIRFLSIPTVVVGCLLVVSNALDGFGASMLPLRFIGYMRRSVHMQLFYFFAGVALLLACQQPAHAAPFNWADCSTCPTFTIARYAYDSQNPNEIRWNPYPGFPARWPNFFWADWDYPGDVVGGRTLR